MKIIEIEQGTPEWLKLRLGKVTGTRLKDAMGKSHMKLAYTLTAELLSDRSKTFKVSAEMQRGIDEESNARKEYEKVTKKKVEEVGFCIHDTMDWMGLSPDGFLPKKKRKINKVYKKVYVKAVEFKCPNSATHVEYVYTNKVPAVYLQQILQYFVVCETLEEIDFVSYDPRVLVKPIHIITVTRKEMQECIDMTMEYLTVFKEKFDKVYNQVVF